MSVYFGGLKLDEAKSLQKCLQKMVNYEWNVSGNEGGNNINHRHKKHDTSESK